MLDFSAFWALQLPLVDSPNLSRGGWSHVCRLELEGRGFYLKRQRNHMTKSFLHPFGEPTLAREFRNIQRYRKLGIPAIEAAFYAEQQVMEKGRKCFCAVLLSHALDGWHDLETWFSRWDEISSE
ncbi:MAG: lipopolysaccharide kinase InaA family protein, partial [Candidatus Accumulibacter sp.]|nr:lipopolysaccharide kinase InaA family protein [Accumulibacter sp.]